MLDAQNPAWERARIFSDGTADRRTRDGNVVRMFVFFEDLRQWCCGCDIGEIIFALDDGKYND